MTGPYHLVTTCGMCAMFEMRRERCIFRGASTRLLKVTTDLLEGASFTAHDLQWGIDLLELKYTALCEVEKKIIVVQDHDEVHPDHFDALA